MAGVDGVWGMLYVVVHRVVGCWWANCVEELGEYVMSFQWSSVGLG